MPEPARKVRKRGGAHVLQVVEALRAEYPEPSCALVHANPYQLLVATILSAQCTDARVNLVTPGLFRRYPDATRLAAAEPAELEALIRSTGFFRSKARNLLAMAGQVVEQHGGEIPADLAALTALGGVGRKTANVVLGTAFGIAEGIVVDTHVKRLARRLGLADGKTPEQIERQLMQHVPPTEWVDLSHRLIQHGRKVCIARKPRCDACPLADICPRVGLVTPAKPSPARKASVRVRKKSGPGARNSRP
ncbi:MAG: endonuclease III [Isosphaeraceae bacterium]